MPGETHEEIVDCITIDVSVKDAPKGFKYRTYLNLHDIGRATAFKEVSNNKSASFHIRKARHPGTVRLQQYVEKNGKPKPVFETATPSKPFTEDRSVVFVFTECSDADMPKSSSGAEDDLFDGTTDWERPNED